MNKNICKIAFTFILSLSLTGYSFAVNDVAVILRSCTVTSSTIDFDLFIRNASGEPMILQSAAFGINWNYSGVGGTASSNISINYIPGSSQLASGQSNFTNNNCYIENSQPATAPTHSIRMLSQVVVNPGLGTSLPQNLDIKVGTFRLTNITGIWTSNSTPDFIFNLVNATGITRTTCTVYMNGASTAAVGTLSPPPFIESPCDTLLLNSTTGLNNIDAINEYSLYPNPVFNRLQLKKLNSDLIKEIRIINSHGQHMPVDCSLFGNQESIEINTSYLTPGIYVIQITSDKKTFTRNFIKK